MGVGPSSYVWMPCGVAGRAGPLPNREGPHAPASMLNRLILFGRGSGAKADFERTRCVEFNVEHWELEVNSPALACAVVRRLWGCCFRVLDVSLSPQQSWLPAC